MKQSNPNIVLVHSHDLGRQLGCYGRDVATPRLDEFATNGALFENHFVTAPQCSPSRGSLMTGLHPHQNGLMGLAHTKWELSEEITALPEYLVSAGYETHLFGLQHVTNHPERIGIQHVHSEGNLQPAASPEIHEVNRARSVAKTVQMFLEKRAYTEPFFASVGVFELHRIQVGDKFVFDDGQYEVPDPETVTVPDYLTDSEGIREDLAEMQGMLAAIDDAMAVILSALEEAGLSENTLVIFTTEHGIAFPRAKGSCYDPGIEGALLMRFPGFIDDGKRYDELVSNVDLLPTILDLVEGIQPSLEDAKSFLPLLGDYQYRPRECLFAEMSWHDRYNPVRAVRTNQYKYIRNFWCLPEVYLSTDVFVSRAGREMREELLSNIRPYEELYDLETDPTEETNLAADPEYKSVKADLERELHQWMKRTEDPLLDGPILPPDMDEIMNWGMAQSR